MRILNQLRDAFRGQKAGLTYLTTDFEKWQADKAFRTEMRKRVDAGGTINRVEMARLQAMLTEEMEKLEKTAKAGDTNWLFLGTALVSELHSLLGRHADSAALQRIVDRTVAIALTAVEDRAIDAQDMPTDDQTMRGPYQHAKDIVGELDRLEREASNAGFALQQLALDRIGRVRASMGVILEAQEKVLAAYRATRPDVYGP